MGFAKIPQKHIQGIIPAKGFTICLGEGAMGTKICQCGSQHFYISSLDKKKVEVTCVLCGLFYGVLIPVLPIGFDSRWVMVSHN